MSKHASLTVSTPRPWLKPLLLMSVAGTLISLLSAYSISNKNAEVIAQHTAQRGQAVINQLDDRLRSYAKGVRGARGAVLAGGQENISKQTFALYSASRDIRLEFPGARGFGFIRRVPFASSEQFIAAARRTIDPNFNIHQFTPHQSERFVVELIEPLADNPKSPGADIASDPRRRSVALAAMHRGIETLSAPIQAQFQLDHPQQLLLLLLPIYRPGMPVDSVTQREAATFGWAYAPLIADEILADVVANNTDLFFTLSDVESEAQPLLFFSSGVMNTSTAAPARWQQTFDLLGRQWRIDVQAAPALIAELHLTRPHDVFLLGTAITLMLSTLLAMLTTRKHKQHVIDAQQSLLASIVENSTDAILVEDPHGTITTWNRQAELLFGYSEQEAVGRSLAELLVPPELRHEDAELLERCSHGMAIEPFDTLRRCRDGRLLDVAVTAIPMTDSTGRVSAIAKIIRDISKQKQAELSLKNANAQLAQTIESTSHELNSVQRDLRTIMDALPSMIGYWDAQLINRFANLAHQQVFGIEATAIVGMHLRELSGEHGFAELLPFCEAVLRGEPQTFERSHSRADGSVKQSVTQFLPDIVDGKVQGFYALVTDISEIAASRHKLAELIRENDALMQTIHEHSLVSVADRDGLITDANKAFCRVSGYSREELLGQNHRIVNSGLQPPEFWQSMWRTLKRGKTWRGEICNRAKDGSLYWVDSSIAPMLDQDGRVIKYISIRTDVTAHKHALRRLAENEAFLERTSQISGVGGFRNDLRSGRIAWSKNTYQIHEVDESCPLTFELVDSMLLPETRTQMRNLLEQARTSGTGFDVVIPLTTARGRPIWVRMIGEVELEDGQPVALTGAMRDITEQRNQELALRASQSFLARVGAVAGVGGWEADLRTGEITWTEETRRLHEVDADYVPTLGTAVQFYTPESRQQVEQALQACVEQQQPYDMELELISAKGRRLWARATGMVELEQGIAVRLVGAFQDITERRRNAEQLAQLSSLLKSVLDSSSEVAIIAGDPNLVITVFNAGAEQLLGYRSTELIGRATPVVFHDVEEIRERGRQLSEAQGRVIEGGAVFTEPSTLRQPHEWTYIHKDGRRIPVSLVITPMHAENGALLGYLGIAHDITSQLQYEESLRIASANAESANKAKSEFLANMSHEIRTPLNAVIGLGYLLEQTPLNDHQHSLLTKIQFAGRALLGVINNVLDLSKIEAGEMTLEEVPCDLHELQTEITELLKPQAQKKGIELRVRSEPNVPHRVHCDATRLRQMLINLLNNSIKFTERGSVQLHTSLVTRAAQTVRLRFAVSDTGIGIAPEALERMFTPFAQADASTTRRFGGTGLGLSITRRFVELMGGAIGVNSTVGVGSEFWFEVPLRVEDALRSPIASELRILIASASGAAPAGLVEKVRLLGWTPTVVDSSEAVRKHLRAATNASWPEVLLLEAPLRGIGAVQFLTTLTQEFTRPLPKIVVNTQPLTSQDKAALLPLTNGLLSPPFDSSALFDVINSIVTSRDGRREPLIDTNGRTQLLRGVRVLVADDSEVNLMVASGILEKHGASVVTCDDGSEAVEYLRVHGHASGTSEAGVDIVLMDVQMPVLDGNAAAICIRNQLNLKELPIIALTAGALVSERQRSIESGMSDFLTKPFEPRALIRLVQRYVKREQASAPDPATATPSSSPSGNSAIDAEVVQRTFGDDQRLFATTLARVLQEYGEFALPVTVDAQDVTAQTQLRARVHTLRRSAGAIGATDVQRVAGAVEHALETHADPALIETLLQQLATAFTLLREQSHPLLATWRTQVDMASAHTGAALDESQIAQLLSLLDSRSVDAIAMFQVNSVALSALLGALRFEHLRSAMQAQDFHQAALLLRATPIAKPDQATG